MTGSTADIIGIALLGANLLALLWFSRWMRRRDERFRNERKRRDFRRCAELNAMLRKVGVEEVTFKPHVKIINARKP